MEEYYLTPNTGISEKTIWEVSKIHKISVDEVLKNIELSEDALTQLKQKINAYGAGVTYPYVIDMAGGKATVEKNGDVNIEPTIE